MLWILLWILHMIVIRVIIRPIRRTTVIHKFCLRDYIVANVIVIFKIH